MRRWHNETAVMYRRWKQEMGIHGYDWRCPPTDPSACHCVTGIGFFRKRRPLDCGNVRCDICHSGKWDVPGAINYGRSNRLRGAILYEEEAYGISFAGRARATTPGEDQREVRNILLGIWEALDRPEPPDLPTETLISESLSKGKTYRRQLEGVGRRGRLEDHRARTPTRSTLDGSRRLGRRTTRPSEPTAIHRPGDGVLSVRCRQEGG